jgi:small GTP-binding protein
MLTPQSDTPSHSYKVVLISAFLHAGKSTLLQYFIHDKFVKQSRQTSGADFAEKTIQIKDKKIKLQIWDTDNRTPSNGGTHLYIRNADAVALVVDPLSSVSAEKQIEQMKLTIRIADPKPHCQYFITATHADKLSHEKHKQVRENLQEITIESNYQHSSLTSAKWGLNVKAFFEEIATTSYLAEQERLQIPPIRKASPYRINKKHYASIGWASLGIIATLGVSALLPGSLTGTFSAVGGLLTHFHMLALILGGALSLTGGATLGGSALYATYLIAQNIISYIQFRNDQALKSLADQDFKVSNEELPSASSAMIFASLDATPGSYKDTNEDTVSPQPTYTATPTNVNHTNTNIENDFATLAFTKT